MLNFFIYRSVFASVIAIIIPARLFHDCRSPAFSGFRLTRGDQSLFPTRFAASGR
jgi:hypothetical protein